VALHRRRKATGSDVPYNGQPEGAFTAERFSCVLGMLSSLEVKVLCPT